ncbi:MAG: helix-turn-helix transcriptional regulator [Prevotella sp.]|nr:helix-turn-helix transcriptional regulator [Candidatus Prevotella equi]
MSNNLGNKETLAKNILRYVEIKGISCARLAEEIGVPATTLSNWVNANTYPRMDKIEMMANYFGISKADLVEEQTAVSATAARSAKLVKNFERLSDRDKLIIENMIASMLG